MKKNIMVISCIIAALTGCDKMQKITGITVTPNDTIEIVVPNNDQHHTGVVAEKTVEPEIAELALAPSNTCAEHFKMLGYTVLSNDIQYGWGENPRYRVNVANEFKHEFIGRCKVVNNTDISTDETTFPSSVDLETNAVQTPEITIENIVPYTVSSNIDTSEDSKLLSEQL